jgi:hypothetical protein
MTKREWMLPFRCSHEGCSEKTMFRYDTKRDLERSYEQKNYSNGRWKCLRHSDLSRVLSLDNRETHATVVVEQKEHGKYFGSSGLVSGPGFLAFAADLPVGTQLIVTARIELPPAPERPLVRCAAGRDGECSHSECPQLRDGEPVKSGRHCPLDVRDEED